MASEDLIAIESAGDPRIVPYLNLKDRDLAREGGRFVAEGELLVRRLFESSLRAESVLLSRRRAEEIAPIVPRGIPIYVADSAVVNRIVGYRFHSGVMAVGWRPALLSLEQAAQSWGSRVTLVVCPELANTENLGLIIRISAAMGADALLLGERSCDPFYRQSVRVSMGAAFTVPIIQSQNLLGDLEAMHDRWGVERFATVLDEMAEPLASVQRPARMAILFGNEAQGLGPEELRRCDRRITIPMSHGTDSLNVAMSAAIMLFHFTQGAGS